MASNAALEWTKSSYSTYEGNCVEIAATSSQTLVRDSRNLAGAWLAVGASAWAAFLAGIRNGEFDPSACAAEGHLDQPPPQ